MRQPRVAAPSNGGWLGGGPSAYVVHPEAHQAGVVSIFRITPRDEQRRVRAYVSGVGREQRPDRP